VIDSPLSNEQVQALASIVGAEHVSTTPYDLLAHSRDMWPRSVLWTKQGRNPYPPAGVVSPSNAEEVAAVLKWANDNTIPVIAFGAGSGVCAGALPIKSGIVLNLKRMNQIHSLDRESLVLEVGPGIYGEHLERRLEPMGYTMGHFPSSIYCSTLGGYLAARSAGQASSRYGKIEDMAVGLEFALTDGSLHRTPMSPTGSSRLDWRQVAIGSEGTLGVITRAWMRVHPLAETRTYQSYHTPSVRSGLDVMRRVMQAGLKPAVMRLYDEFDTVVFSTHGEATLQLGDLIPQDDEARGPLWKRNLLDVAGLLKKHSVERALRYPKVLNAAIDRLPGRCLLIILTEGSDDIAQYEAQRIREIADSAKIIPAGEAPARYWVNHRYDISYKQSKIFDSGAWVDTMEVATTWKDVERLYQAVRRAVSPDAFIMAHFSHAYRDGCCVYFSFASSAPSDAALEALHSRVWENALEAVHANGGTITHHHGVGMSKGAMLPIEFGELWPLWRNVKTALDPAGVMNPGKLGEHS
jgi:alkyldihydroxyacetonephosphate synthase